jgi:uncharacterized protein with GYD domain
MSAAAENHKGDSHANLRHAESPERRCCGLAQGFEQLERKAVKQVRKECPNVAWIGSYAVLGPCDYLDVFRADDTEAATKVSALIRAFGHAQTEIWAATEWDRFKEIVRTLPAAA